MEYTKGEWKAVETEPNNPDSWEYHVTCDVGYKHTVCRDANVDNAHLIAAAPDMYEACKQALRTFEAHKIRPFDPRYLKLSQALAKAEGKE